MKANFYSFSTESLNDAINAANGGIDFQSIEVQNQTIAHITHESDLNGLSIWFCYGTGNYYFTDDVASLQQMCREDLEQMALINCDTDDYYDLKDTIYALDNNEIIDLITGMKSVS